MVYFICGHRGCGKSYIVNQLKSLVDCDIYDTGPILRTEYKNLELDLSFSEWIKNGEQQYGKDFTNYAICKNINLDSDRNNIIIGNRSMEGIKFIVNFFGISDYKICFIDGNYDLFRLNYNSRENLNLDVIEFNEIINLEIFMGIKEIEDFVKNNLDNNLYFYKEKNDDIILQSLLDDMSKKKKMKLKK